MEFKNCNSGLQPPNQDSSCRPLALSKIKGVQFKTKKKRIYREEENDMYDVVTFGEAMVRLSPPHFERLEQTRSLNVNVGGAELNVAVGVTRFGLKSAWVSKLPKNSLSGI